MTDRVTRSLSNRRKKVNRQKEIVCQKITRNEGDRWRTKLFENRIDDGMIPKYVFIKLIVERQTLQEEKRWIQKIKHVIYLHTIACESLQRLLGSTVIKSARVLCNPLRICCKLEKISTRCLWIGDTRKSGCGRNHRILINDDTLDLVVLYFLIFAFFFRLRLLRCFFVTFAGSSRRSDMNLTVLEIVCSHAKCFPAHTTYVRLLPCVQCGVYLQVSRSLKGLSTDSTGEFPFGVDVLSMTVHTACAAETFPAVYTPDRTVTRVLSHMHF